MKLKQILFLLSAILISSHTSAQSMDIYLSHYPYKVLTVTIQNGLASDTIYHGEMDDKGKAHVVLPDSFRGYKGIATLKTGDYARFDFIMSQEDASLTCIQEYPYAGTVTFKNSSENDSILKWLPSQEFRDNKMAALSQILNFYKEGDSFYLPLNVEKQQMEKQQQAFDAILEKSNLYAARFMILRDFTKNKLAQLELADQKINAEIRCFIRDSLDINSLFTSGMWFSILNGILPLYEDNTPFHDMYIDDMIVLLDRTSDDKIYGVLADNILSICQTMGWNKHSEDLVAYLINGRRIAEPTDQLKNLFTLFKLAKGSKAPALTSGRLGSNKTIVAFYDSGCGNCHTQMQKLVEDYGKLKEKGYDVISISADVDQDVFEKGSKDYPWKKKICDFKGFEGTDFVNYGILGTPVFFVVEKGIIKGVYAQVDKILSK